MGEPILSEPVTGSWSGWKLVELYLPATGEPVDDLIVGLETQPGTGTLYIDSWGLYLTDRPAPASAEGQEEPQKRRDPEKPGDGTAQPGRHDHPLGRVARRPGGGRAEQLFLRRDQAQRRAFGVH